MENPKLSAEAAVQLQEGINFLLRRWAALQMAVENEWGGRDSRTRAQQLAPDIFSLFTQTRDRVYIEDVEDMLEDCMLSLNTQIGDGSIEEISEKLMIMHEECLEGNFLSIQRLREAVPPPIVAVPHIQQDDGSDTSSSEDEGGDGLVEMAVDDAPESEPKLNQMMDEDQQNKATNSTAAEVEDGWTVVASKRNRGAKR